MKNSQILFHPSDEDRERDIKRFENEGGMQIFDDKHKSLDNQVHDNEEQKPDKSPLLHRSPFEVSSSLDPELKLKGLPNVGQEIIPESEFEKELAALISKHYLQHGSNTPDFLLAKYLMGCLKTFNGVIRKRDQWYGDGIVEPKVSTTEREQPHGDEETEKT